MADEVLRPSVEEMRDRVDINLHGIACPECGKSCKSRQNLAMHMQKHQNSTDGLTPGFKRAQLPPQLESSMPATTPAICPACNQQCSTMAVLLKHYMRKHVEAANFPCPKCGHGHKTKADLKAHEPLCLKGPDEGKVIRCLACQFLSPNVNAWVLHQRMTKHRACELCWPDGSSGQGPQPTSLSAVPTAFGVVLDDDEVVRADGLAADADPASEDEAVVVHVGQLEVLNPYARVARPKKVPRHG